MTPEDEWRALERIAGPWNDAEVIAYWGRKIGIAMRWELWIIARACRPRL